MVAHAKAPSKDSCSTRGGEVRLSYTQDAAPREVRVEPENHNLPAVESLQCKDSAASESVCGRPAVSALWSSVACTARPLCASGLGQATTRGRLKHRLLTQPSQERCHPGKQVPTFTGRRKWFLEQVFLVTTTGHSLKQVDRRGRDSLPCSRERFEPGEKPRPPSTGASRTAAAWQHGRHLGGAGIVNAGTRAPSVTP